MSDIYDLPEITFADKSADDIESALIVTYEAVSGRALAPGDPVRLFLETIAAIIVQQRALIDFAGKQNLLRYAAGDFLDHIGAFTGTVRMEAVAAQTTLQFTLSAPQQGVITIPAGTRATPDGLLYFVTTTAVQIPAGQLTVDVTASCMTTGEQGNGYIPGQINILVDPIPFVESVVNITTSFGGSEREDDDAYRERIRVSPEGFSVAGPTEGYVYWTKSASSLISDAIVTSPAAGQVEIRLLLKGGVIPDQAMLDLVAAAVNDRSVRPLTDQVTVLPPAVVPYDITLTYYIDQSRATQASAIQTAVNQAITGYAEWQKERLGRDINPSELTARVMNAGAKRLVITSPVYTALEPHQVAIVGTATVTYGGLE